MKLHPRGFFSLPLFALAVLSAASSSARAASHPADVQSLVGESTHWTAAKWTAEDIALFGGEPTYYGTHKDIILVRYSFFVSDYDTEQLCPLWVAHVDHAGALAKGKVRVSSHDLKWDRPPGFFSDPNVVKFSEAHHRPYTVQDSYTNANPSELPATPAYDITRGHNASNDEMKLSGNEDEGVISQHESFSLANVSPQTQRHNAPMWAALEHDCLLWADKLGSVAVITGPVYMTDASLPAPVNKILLTNGKKGPLIPIPTHFFKIIIGRMDGKLAAVGFLVPHLSDLKQDDYKRYAVPISKIETATHLKIMPTAPLPADKNVVDHRWLDLLPAH